MKRMGLPVLVLLCAALVLVAGAPATAAYGREFLGKWHGTDVDLSNMELWITADGWSGGRVFHIRLADDDTGEGFCGGHARGEALGIVREPNRLAVSGTWWCLDPIENILDPWTWDLTYDASTDTISDGSVTYYRGG